VIRSGPTCGGDAAGASARWLGDEAALRAALAAGAPLGGAAAPAPPVDFRREGVVLVASGRHPTAGHALSLHDAEVAVAGGVATLVVRFEEPPPGAILAQVVTSPCLLVRLPRGGAREVRIVDPAGAVRARAAIP
jgi:hypothetical protein